MGQFYSGINASLSVDGIKLGKVKSWSFSASSQLLDTTTLGDSVKTQRHGNQSFSGSAELLYYVNESGQLEGKPLIGSLIRTGTVPSDQTYRMKLATAERSVEFNAVVNSVSIGAQAGDVMAASIAFDVNGPLVEASLGGN